MLLAVVLSGFVSGCGSSLSPLYADFRIDEPPADSTSAAGVLDSTFAVAPDTTIFGEPISIPDSLNYSGIQRRIAEALVSIGWELDEPDAPNVVSTKEVEIAEWGLYDVRVSLDVVPINNRFVRVYVHPYRRYFYGSRSKMSYMNSRVRGYVFEDLAEAFAARGIIGFGAPPPARDSETDEDGEAQDSMSTSLDLAR